LFNVIHGLQRVARWGSRYVRVASLCLAGWSLAAPAQVYINEVLFNPPGTDSPNQYIELRGQPNYLLPNGTYFVTVNGSAANNPGTVCDLFDLSGKALGGNGLLILLQKTNSYAVNSNATVLANTNGPGWGSGSSSSVGHTGPNGQTDLPHPSLTFFLIQTFTAPALGDDIDTNDDGVPDGPVWAGWRVMDSVGVLNNHGAGDVAYGAINFRRNAPPGNGATASGTIVPVGFTPDYVARAGNTIGSAAGDWVAGGSLAGSAPNWILSDTQTIPTAYNSALLNHLGRPNFGAPDLNGVVAVCPPGGLILPEGGPAASYWLGLNTAPAGNVTVRVTAQPPLQVSTNGGFSWGAIGALTFNSTNFQAVLVRALADNVIDISPRLGEIRNAIASSADIGKYPITALGPVLSPAILEAGWLLLNEVKGNPPGTNDAPWEYVELLGPPNALLTNVYFLSIESAGSKNPGKANLVIDLTSVQLGGNGLLIIGATNNPYQAAGATTLVGDARFDQVGGALGNGSRSFLLVSSPQPIAEGTDLDAGDNGIPEGLPDGTTLLDSVGFSEGGANDVFYSPAVLALSNGVPDAAIRFPANTNANSMAAWCYGELAGTTGETLVFESTGLSSNFPPGAVLTPGQANDISLTLTSIGPFSGVVGDPTNPGLTFTVADANNPNAAALAVFATSANPLVVPDSNLTVVAGAGGLRTLYLDPIGVGFSDITLTVSNANKTGRITFPYGASAMGRTNGIFTTGASDASTANAVDANYMFVGDDEAPTIRLYDRRRSGGPISQFDFHPYLDLTGQESGEVDIECSTRVGNRLFWMGSHSHSNLAENRTNRMRFFATDMGGTGTNAQLVFLGYYRYFKDDVINWDKSNGHGKGTNYYGLAASGADSVNPKAPDGFNIEGLSMAPGSTNAAYVGFRAPIVPPTNRTFALIVPVLNFAQLATQGGPAGSCLFGAPIELDLYGRGIRSIEGTTNGYLISAGIPGDGKSAYPLDFKLYTWTGNAADQPEQRAADLSGLQPEGIVEPPPPPWTSNTPVQLVSDLGAKIIYDDGIQNKHEPYAAFRKSRADWVTLGPVVKPMPVITSAVVSNNLFTVTWRALKGETYRLQVQTNLSASGWTDISGDVPAAGPFASATVTPPPGSQSFYRVLLP
jgi:hypothetical protein